MHHFASLLLVGVVAGAAAGAPASGPSAVVAYRDSVMKSLGGHMKALGLIAAGQVDYRAHAALHAAAIEGTARVLPSLFPAGSGPDRVKTEALAAVWTDAEGFAAAAARLQAESAKLADAARNADPALLREEAKAVGKACSACHDAYRTPR
jgi:cytochrome c556